MRRYHPHPPPLGSRVLASRNPLLNYYEILGVSRDATQPEIERAFKGGIIRYRDVPGGGEQTRRLNLAYRALSNPERRRHYDAALSGTPLPVTPTGEAEQAAQTDLSPPVAEAPPPPPSPPPVDQAFDEPTYDEDYEEERPRHRRAPLALAGVAALLLVAGGWAGGLFGSDPKVAGSANDTAGAATNAGAASGSAAEEPGSLGDALASLLPSDTPPAPGTGATGPGGAPISAAEPSPANPNGPTARSTVTTQFPSSGSEVLSGDNPPASAEPEAPAEPPAAAPENEAPAAAPPPAPAPDRSAPARLLRGGLIDADNRGGRFQGTVGVRLRVDSNGRPQSCSVTRSSGDAALDRTTCSLLQQRLQFTPARDREGNPTAVDVESTHVWARQRRR